MIDSLTKEELKDLLKRPASDSISIYMPIVRTGKEIEEGPLRLKNLLKLAEEGLKKKGMRSPEVNALLDPARSLMDDSSFWQHQSEGLVIFLSKEKALHYRLPISFDELAIIGQSFHIKPLLPLFAKDDRFFILALSQNEVRMIECSLFGVDEVDLKGAPSSLKEAMRFDNPEKQLQFHIAANTPGKGAHGGSAIFHGHGVGTDDAKTNLLRYFQEVDKGVKEMLKDEKAPLVLAGVGYLLSIYREANSYHNLLGQTIEGSPDRLSIAKLHGRALEIVTPLFERKEEEAAARFENLIATKSKEATNDLEEVVVAAHEGRINILLVAVDSQAWGLFDPSLRKIQPCDEIEAEGQDLLDLAAINTILNGGVVYLKKTEHLPKGVLAGALLRY